MARTPEEKVFVLTHVLERLRAEALGPKGSLKVALDNTPTLGAVTVTGAFSTASYGAAYAIPQKTYQVTFTPDYVSSVNVGPQKPLLCDSGYGCTGAGCQPLVRMPFLYRYAAIGASVARRKRSI